MPPFESILAEQHALLKLIDLYRDEVAYLRSRGHILGRTGLQERWFGIAADLRNTATLTPSRTRTR